jgi:hypothetical protein
MEIVARFGPTERVVCEPIRFPLQDVTRLAHFELRLTRSLNRRESR